MHSFLWFLVGLIVGYIVSVFTWTEVRLWLMKMKEHPIETLERDMAIIRERIEKMRR